MSTATATLRRIRALLWIFIIATALSGATALPLEGEVKLLTWVIGSLGWAPPGLMHWLTAVRTGLVDTNAKYPFIAYGTDWLAFGHFMIALAFVGPLRDPVKNRWVIEWGMLACVLVVPFALGMGAVRGIPFGWRLIDCAFGVFGLVPLWFCRRQIARLVKMESVSASTLGSE